MEINITALAATITALGVIFGAVFGIYRYYSINPYKNKGSEAPKPPSFFRSMGGL